MPLTPFMRLRLWFARGALRLCTWLVPSPLLPALLREDAAADPVPAGTDDGHGYLIDPHGPSFGPSWHLAPDFFIGPPAAAGPTKPEEPDAEPRPKRLH